MPARPAVDPLVPLPVRVPASLRAHLQQLANARGCTLSDAFRAHLTTEQVKLLGVARPRKRSQRELPRVDACDPLLARQVAAIGSNLNQISRLANRQALAGTPLQVVELLAVMRDIERHMSQLVMPAEASDR